MSRYTDDVKKFLEKFGLDGRLTPQRFQSRLELSDEEYDEMKDAAFVTRDPVAYIDGICDTVFVLIGNAILDGYDFDAHWDAIVTSNMAKERGTKSTRPNSGGFDVIKPPGWVGPESRHASLIASQQFPPFAHRDKMDT